MEYLPGYLSNLLGRGGIEPGFLDMGIMGGPPQWACGSVCLSLMSVVPRWVPNNDRNLILVSIFKKTLKKIFKI